MDSGVFGFKELASVVAGWEWIIAGSVQGNRDNFWPLVVRGEAYEHGLRRSLSWFFCGSQVLQPISRLWPRIGAVDFEKCVGVGKTDRESQTAAIAWKSVADWSRAEFGYTLTCLNCDGRTS